MKKSLFLSVILAAVVSGAGAMNLSDSPVSPVKDESVGLVFSRMFNSTRDGLSWAGSKLAGLFARSQQVQQEGCGDLFGGACSSGELQSRIDMNFDRSIFSPLVDSFKGLVGSGVDSRESTGSLDTKLREVEASKVVTQSQIDELRDNRDISDAAKSYALEQLELRKKYLSELERI